jgi:hypothetical protein
MRPRDTSPEAWKVLMERIRQMTPEERLQRCLELTENMRLNALAGLRQAFPNASEREIFLRAAKQRLGSELFYKVYGDELDGLARRDTEINHQHA